MAAIPYIVNVECVSDLLDILGSKTEIGKRLKLLHEAETKVNILLKRYNEFKAVEDFQHVVSARDAAVKEQRRLADAYYAEKKEAGDRLLATVETGLTQREANLKLLAVDLDKQDHAIMAKESEVAKREVAARELKEAAEALKLKSDDAIATAEATKNEYERLIKNIHNAMEK